jgi:hypothetical protein
MGIHRTRAGAVTPAVRFIGALLCVAVVVIHVIDQGGIPGSKTPSYVGIGYWFLEIVGILTAVVLVATPPAPPTWFIAVGVGAGPLLGYVLSRGPGLPSYSDDVGNWFEPLGVLSLAVEAVLIVVALTAFRRDGGTLPGARERFSPQVPDRL